MNNTQKFFLGIAALIIIIWLIMVSIFSLKFIKHIEHVGLGGVIEQIWKGNK